MAFYLWLLAGTVLLGLELFVPGVILAFFGLGAILVAFLVLLFPMPFGLQLFIMLASSILMLILFRNKLVKRLTSDTKKIAFDSVVGKKVKVIQTIPPGLTGHVELHGSHWKAEAHQVDIEISEGTWVIIRGRKNITLIVEPIKKSRFSRR